MAIEIQQSDHFFYGALSFVDYMFQLNYGLNYKWKCMHILHSFVHTWKYRKSRKTHNFIGKWFKCCKDSTSSSSHECKVTEGEIDCAFSYPLMLDYRESMFCGLSVLNKTWNARHFEPSVRHTLYSSHLWHNVKKTLECKTSVLYSVSIPAWRKIICKLYINLM